MMEVICGKPDPADPVISFCGKGLKHEGPCGAWCYNLKELKATLDSARAERDKLAVAVKELGSIAGRVVILNCIKCNNEYTQFSVLSDITCPDCWLEKTAFALEIAERDKRFLEEEVARRDAKLVSARSALVRCALMCSTAPSVAFVASEVGKIVMPALAEIDHTVVA